MREGGGAKKIKGYTMKDACLFSETLVVIDRSMFYLPTIPKPTYIPTELPGTILRPLLEPMYASGSQ